MSSLIREEGSAEAQTIINAAATAYRGIIPDDRWHEPYMPANEFASEREAGVNFWGFEADGELLGVMGFQTVRDVDLIRHAYVRPGNQGRGVGSALLDHLRGLSTSQILSLAPGPPPIGPFAFISVMASCWCRRQPKPGCSRRIGPCPTGRSKVRWFSPILRWRTNDAVVNVGAKLGSKRAFRLMRIACAHARGAAAQCR